VVAEGTEDNALHRFTTTAAKQWVLIAEVNS